MLFKTRVTGAHNGGGGNLLCPGIQHINVVQQQKEKNRGESEGAQQFTKGASGTKNGGGGELLELPELARALLGRNPTLTER